MDKTLKNNILLLDQNLDELSDIELDRLERQIARKYMNDVPWEMVALGFGNLAIWLLLWPLVLFDYLSLWIAFPIAVVNCALAYIPSHEAQHHIIAREGQRLRWLNELLGHLSLIPLAAPFRVLRCTHMEHHANTNHPELDPDYGIQHTPNGWAFLRRSIMYRQPAAGIDKANAEVLFRIGKPYLLIDGLICKLAQFSILGTMAWSGYAIEAALLWWVPYHIALTYIQFYLSWAPHHPAVEQGRYSQSRVFKSQVGNLLSMGMQFHIIHHLYPRIPASKTPAAFYEMERILARRGCDVSALSKH